MKENQFKEKVSIGIPTYNRSHSMLRAIKAAMGQDYQNIEVLVADNASTDDTEAICLEFSRAHDNFKYYRKDNNSGMTKNFNDVLKHASGEYFMWLADDDYIEHNYVSTCLKFLKSNPDYSLVTGKVNLVDRGVILGAGFNYHIRQYFDILRVISCYWNPYEGGVIYGLMKTDQARASRMPNCLAGDWMFVAGMAKQGKIKTLSETNIFKSSDGISDDTSKILRAVRASKLQSTFPYLSASLMSGVEALKYNDAWKANSYMRRLLDATLIIICNVIRHVFIHNIKTIRYVALVKVLGMNRYEKLRSKYLTRYRS